LCVNYRPFQTVNDLPIKIAFRLFVFAIFGVTVALCIHTARVRHIRSVCCSLHPHCSCSSYSEYLLLSASTLLVFIIFGVPVALCIHTARVRYIRSDCCSLRPHCLCLLNTRSECCSLCIYRSSSAEYPNRNARLLASLETVISVQRHCSAHSSHFARFRFHVHRDTKVGV
jgi:hypothetical protein